MNGQAVFTLAAVVLMAASASAGDYSGGDGSAEYPYKIGTPNDLNDIGNYPEDFNDCFVLVNDINMAGFTYTTALIAPDTNSSSDRFQGTPFTGIFDGNDCNIGNLTIDTVGADNDFLALFGEIGQTGEVKNLSIEDVNITGGDYSECLGGLCGFNDGTISDCCATGSVGGGNNSRYLGGLCGENWYGTVSNCYATGSVTGDKFLGGLCGYNIYGTINNCYATGSVTGEDLLGGLCGENYGTISNCYATGSVTGGVHSGALGGLCGWNASGYYGTISNCYATGSVTGDFDLGGLCGFNDSTISNCYATGSVSGKDYLGGLCGYNPYGTISGCYFLDPADGGGPDNGLGTALTETQMKHQSNFLGWDFVEIWNIGENQTYPYLKVYPAGDLNHDGRVDFSDIAIGASHWLEGVEDD